MPKKRLTIALLTLLIDELSGIQGELPSAYGRVIEGEDDEDTYETEPGHVESVDIEIHLSALVTTFTERLGLTEEPESLTALFEEIFSSDDDLVSVASNLEDALNGYFGELFGENLELSDDYFTEMIKELERRRDKWKQKTPLK